VLEEEGRKEKRVVTEVRYMRCAEAEEVGSEERGEEVSGGKGIVGIRGEGERGGGCRAKEGKEKVR